MDRFWSKVDKRGSDDCWMWQAACTKDGYGAFRVKRSVMARAHRMAYTLVKGEIPERLQVLHSCDNPACCNPAHLRVGTQAENIADREKRNRCTYATGTRHGQAKLTEQQVQRIRIVGGALPQQRLAKLMGVTQSVISRVLTNKAWSHLKYADK